MGDWPLFTSVDNYIFIIAGAIIILTKISKNNNFCPKAQTSSKARSDQRVLYFKQIYFPKK